MLASPSCSIHPTGQLLLRKAPLIPALRYKRYPCCCRGYHLTVLQSALCLISKNRHEVWVGIFKSPLLLGNARLKLPNHKLTPTQHLQQQQSNSCFCLPPPRCFHSFCNCLQLWYYKNTSTTAHVYSRWNQIHSSFGWLGYFCIEKNLTCLHTNHTIDSAKLSA